MKDNFITTPNRKVKTEKTKVKFLLEHEGAGVYAFFPDEYAAPFGTYRTAYAHVGQHSACALEYANESEPATPEQYEPLKQELESIGYDLEIVN